MLEGIRNLENFSAAPEQVPSADHEGSLPHRDESLGNSHKAAMSSRLTARENGPTRECLAARIPRIANYLRKKGYGDAVVARAVEKAIQVAERFLATGRAHQLKHRVGWLYAVAELAAAKVAKCEPTFVSLEAIQLDLPLPAEDKDAEERRQAMRKAVDAALACLTAKQRAAVDLHYMQKMSLRRAAKQLGITPEALFDRLRSARRRLAKVLGPGVARGPSRRAG